MKSTITFLILFIFIISCSSVKDSSERAKSSILGKISKKTWIDSTNTLNIYHDFQPDSDEISKLSEMIEDSGYHFVLFAGADCNECHEYLPQLLKTFDMAGITEDRYNIYVLDRKLEEPGGVHKKFDIPTTPTVFILKNDIQIGMITYPDFDWADEIIQIIEKEHNED
jgi:thioredoxin-related protein